MNAGLIPLVYRLGLAALGGCAFISVVYNSMNANALSAFLGIALLMPGITASGVIPFHNASPLPMLVMNALIYSGLFFLPVWLLTKKFDLRRLQRFSVISAAVVVALSAAVITAANFLKHKDWGQLCRNDLINEFPSPDYRHKAVLFSRGCGVLGDTIQSQVSILKPENHIDVASEGNIFMAEEQWNEATKRWGLDVGLQWQGPRKLVIVYPNNAKTFKTESKWNDVDIVFETRGAL